MRRTRALRPSSRNLLVVVIVAVAVLGWLAWELGRLIIRPPWWKTVLLLSSGLTFVLFAIGWIVR